ncbi:ISXO2-like transposase domain-containing protein [Salegentibacter echinorum]|uniref:ISXO2-like transposase domain-containing protein n=1 Tax=Salegentibacter echinorum TaxID=1073325 RepID=A0A1M5HFI4_SALEC|nr:ISXO2-like transposase domain-containing protein [Salegentibacter echinorum]
MKGLVHVDEFIIGGQEENAPGRSYNTPKTKVIITVELNEERKVKRVYAKVINDYSAKSFTPLFEQHISEEAKVITDKWRGLQPIKEKV